MRWAFDQYETVVASNREEAIAQLRRHEPAVVTMDLGLPPAPDDVTEGSGCSARFSPCARHQGRRPHRPARSRERRPCRGHGRLRLLRQALRARAARPHLDRALGCTTCSRTTGGSKVQQGSALVRLITRDAGMLKVCRLIEKVASANVTVMLLGESGTGKEVLAGPARAVAPPRERFCGDQLCGDSREPPRKRALRLRKGAFTGAVKQTGRGKIEVANKGTLFLDEIGDLPMPCRPSCCASCRSG